VVQWLTRNVVRQSTWRIDRYLGWDERKKWRSRVEPGDMEWRMVVLPEAEDYSGLVEGVEPEEYVEREVEVRDWGAVKRGRERAFAEAFYEEKMGPIWDEWEARVQEFLERIPKSDAYRFEPVRYVQEGKWEQFITAGRSLGMVAETQQIQDEGFWEPVRNIPVVEIANPTAPTKAELRAIFEELFHATARHEIDAPWGKEPVDAFVERKGEFRGWFFEESLDGLAFVKFVQEQGFDVTDIEKTSDSQKLSYVLYEMLMLDEDQEVSMVDLLLDARLGERRAEERLRQRIDRLFGEGTFAHLMNLTVADGDKVMAFYERITQDQDLRKV
jgi:hypothetical protein